MAVRRILSLCSAIPSPEKKWPGREGVLDLPMIIVFQAKSFRSSLIDYNKFSGLYHNILTADPVVMCTGALGLV